MSPTEARLPECTAGTVVCMPVFNDWAPAAQLVAELAALPPEITGGVGVVLVDDGSTDPLPDGDWPAPTPGLVFVEVLRVRSNVGHQRAIALGLCHIYCRRPCSFVIVMDGDGQDAPGDVPRLLERCRQDASLSVVFAQRQRRSESLLFVLGYQGFRVFHRLLTGRRVEVGNFSAVPFALLERLVGIPELWNHYAAAVIHARIPVEKVPAPRRKRRSGTGKMNPTSLAQHGLSAIAVYGAVIGVRMLFLTGALMLLTTAILIAASAAGWSGVVPLPSWAAAAAAYLFVVLLNLFLLSMLFVLFVLQTRNASIFVPLRDWEYFVTGVVPLSPRPPL